MPSIKDKTTVDALAREYCSNGRNKAKAMETIGYADSSCKSGQAVGDVYGNLRVEAAIKAIDDKTAKKAERTVQSLDQMYQDIVDAAMDDDQLSAAVSATTGIARLYGMDKQTTITEHIPDQPEGKEAEALEQANKQYKLKLAGTGS